MSNNKIYIVAGLAVLVLVFFNPFAKAESTVSLSIRVEYSDGTVKTFDSKNGPITLMVAQSGSQVSITKITYVIKASPAWTDRSVISISPVTWSVLGKVSVDGATKQDVTGSGPILIKSGEVYTISTTILDGSVLNGWIPFDYKDHVLRLIADIYCTFTPPGDSAKEISGSVLGDLTLHNIGFPVLLTVTLETQIT